MYKRNIADTRKGRKEGIISHLLLQKPDCPEAEIAVTWVEIEPDAAQNPHCHASEQVYIIIQGKGLMLVGAEEAPVTPGDVVHIPPNAIHGITNTGKDYLVYVTATTPPYDLSPLYPDPD